jgi:hypothetical protein
LFLATNLMWLFSTFKFSKTLQNMFLYHVKTVFNIQCGISVLTGDQFNLKPILKHSKYSIAKNMCYLTFDIESPQK